MAQAEEYAKVFGSDGTATLTLREFFDAQKEMLKDLADDTAAITDDLDLFDPNTGERRENDPRRLASPLPRQNQIGQSGLVSSFLGDSQVSMPSPGGGQSTQNINTKNEASISLDLRGVEPLIQRIAATTALEIVKNVMAGAQ